MTNENPTNVKPLLTKERMREIVSSQPSITSEAFYREMDKHLGRRNTGRRKLVFEHGRSRWDEMS